MVGCRLALPVVRVGCLESTFQGTLQQHERLHRYHPQPSGVQLLRNNATQIIQADAFLLQVMSIAPVDQEMALPMSEGLFV